MQGLVACLEDSLARREVFDLDTRGEDLRFVVIEKLKKWNMAELLGLTGHGGTSGRLEFRKIDLAVKIPSRFDRFILIRL